MRDNISVNGGIATGMQGYTLRYWIAPFQGCNAGLKLSAIEQNNAVIAEFFGYSALVKNVLIFSPKNIRNLLIKTAGHFATSFKSFFSSLCLRGKIFLGLQPYLLLVVLAFLLLPILSFAQSHNSLIRDGNTNYEKNDYTEAEIKYRKALEAKPASYTAMFNLGDALYKEKHYDDAAKQFENAATLAPDKLSRAKAFHNLGNTYMSQQKWDESINAYKQALKNDPTDADTKYNLSYALDKKKDQDKKNQNGKGGGGQGDKDKDKNGQNKQGQGQQKDQQGQGDQNKQAQQQKAGPAMTDRDLDAVNEEEKNTQKKVMMELMKKQPKNNDNKTDKPW